MDVNFGFEEIVSLFKCDIVLVVCVICISNSVVYGLGGGIVLIEDVVGCVGFVEVYWFIGFVLVV